MRLLTFLIILIFSPFSFALTSQQSHYKKAVDAINKGDRISFEAHARQLRGYILEPYIDYYRAKDLRLGNKKAIDAFLHKHKNKPIADRLLSKWLDYLMKNGQYQHASRYTARAHATSSRCHILYAKTRVGQQVDYLPNKDLWLHGGSRPDACDPIFAYWKAGGAIGPHAYSQRAKLALKTNNYKFAKRLSPKATTEVRNLIAWQQKKRRAISRAKGFPANGYELLAALPKSVQDDEVRKWKAKQFIFHANWKNLLREINRMPQKQQAEDQWRYWKARALARLGKRKQAIALYREVAKSTNYYGFLSADRLSLPYTICKKNKAVDQKTFFRRFPEIARAFELRRVGSPYFAGMEWNAALRRMKTNDDKISASVLAGQQGWYIKGILALGKLKEWQYYDVRFPMLWRTQVDKEAKRRGLSPAFIYGIMRTESAMRPNAKSPVGARGLMQVMPATARRTGKKYGLPGTGNAALLQPRYNIPIGAAYLHWMGEKWNKQLILMIASYNAGPANVAKWVKKLPKEADRFIESIPFNETRKYVTRVLDYTTMYNWKINQTAKRIGYRISNIGSSSPYIKAKGVYIRPVCK